MRRKVQEAEGNLEEAEGGGRKLNEAEKAERGMKEAWRKQKEA